MAYDYTKDPNWIKFEAEQRIKRENWEIEKCEYKIFGGGRNASNTGEFCYVTLRDKTYFCSIANVNFHPKYGFAEFAIFPKNGENIDYANPVHMERLEDTMGFIDRVHRYFKEAQNVLQKSKN